MGTACAIQHGAATTGKQAPGTQRDASRNGERFMDNRKQTENSASSQDQLQPSWDLDDGGHSNSRVRSVFVDKQPAKQSNQSRTFYRLGERRSNKAVSQSARDESAEERTKYPMENRATLERGSEGFVPRLRERREAAQTINRLAKKQQELEAKGATKEELATVRAQIQVANVDYNYASYYPVNLRYISLYARAMVNGKSQSVARIKPPLWHVAQQCLMNGTLDRFRNGEFNHTVPTSTVIREVGGGGATVDTPEKSAVTESWNNKTLYPSHGVATPSARLQEHDKVTDNEGEDDKPLDI